MVYGCVIRIDPNFVTTLLKQLESYEETTLNKMGVDC